MIVRLPSNRRVRVLELRRRATCSTCSKPIRVGQRAVTTRNADGEVEYRHAHTDCLAPRSNRAPTPCPRCGVETPYAHRFHQPGAKQHERKTA